MKIFAHRGISALYPENSQSAISACTNEFMHGVEIDLFQAEEDFFVVHDPWLSRLFGINKKITSASARSLKELVCQDNRPIPTLEWLLAHLADKNLTLNIELKTVLDIKHFIKKMNELIAKYQFPAHLLLISSFNHQYLATIHQQQPNWKLGMLIAHLPLSIEQYVNQLPLFSIHLCIDAISADLIKEIKQHKLQDYVYTVDQQEDIKWLAANKVDGIFANHPEQAHKIVNNLM